ncbi:MAG: hypothetical protein ACK5SI_14620 [Planctomycetia bacterium]|jgi:hypothetical protein
MPRSTSRPSNAAVVTALVALIAFAPRPSAWAEDKVVVRGNVGNGVAVTDLSDVDIIVEAAEDGPQPAAGHGGGIFGVFRGFFNPRNAVPDLPVDLEGGDDGPMPDDPEKAAAWQQRQQMRQQAGQMVQLLQPILHAELELVRNACGDLPAETRGKLLAAGRKAVNAAAVAFAKQQMGGGAFGGDGANTDPKRLIRESVGRAVKTHVPAEGCAAYERQVALRSVRRERAGRDRIVRVLDRQLALTPEQQRAIEADLEKKWDAGWPWAIDTQGMEINGYRPAPDYASACILPHLDEQQRGAWQSWCTAAGVREHGLQNWGNNWNFGGHQGLDLDAWWGK